MACLIAFCFLLLCMLLIIYNFLFLYTLRFSLSIWLTGERTFTQNEVQTVQYGAFVGQVNHAHQPPTVSTAER